MSDKQAVLLIHGIGEQRPMETLRGFVHAVWSTDSAVHHPHAKQSVWSKPDTVSGSYELRRLTTSKNRAGVRTDFFELYWAHLMSGTEVSHVTAWAKLLLLRWPWSVPKRLFGVWLLLVLTILGIGGTVIYNAVLPDAEKLLRLPVWATTVAGFVLSAVIGYVVIQVIGDAARYLNAAPPNIERRQEIRAKGIEILKKLHENDYGRIIVVGHSLGSVIGYDILTHAWADFNTGHNAPEDPHEASLLRIESLIAKAASTPADRYRAAQRAYLRELEANGNRWRVTDFVTLGSPLTHAAILLAKDAEELATKRSDREFPCCPPVTEDSKIAYDFSYEIKPKAGETEPRSGSMRVPHHAAVFAPTRWTNLYFPAHFVMWGDVVGGPLSPVFGPWVRDLAVSTRRRLGFLSHTLYWKVSAGKPPSAAVVSLRDALSLVDADSAVVVPSGGSR